MKIGTENIARGESRSIVLPITQLYTQEELNLRVIVRRGKEDGPVLLLTAALHGDELNGVEIINQVLARKALRRLRGTILAVPVVNPLAFLARSRYLPDRRDLNRSFPGSASGSLASRLADTLITEVAQRATHCIDLHTAAINRTNLPQVRCTLSEPGVEPLARAFGAPIILDSSAGEGFFRSALSALGTPTIVYEGGQALRIDEMPVKAGVSGVLSCLRALNMLPDLKKPKESKTFVANSSFWLRAPQTGIFRSKVKLGQQVSQGTELGLIHDPFGEVSIPIKADKDGIVFGMTKLPLCYEGEALMHIALFNKPEFVEQIIDEYEASHSEEGALSPQIPQ